MEFYVESGDDGRTKAVQVTGPAGAPPQVRNSKSSVSNREQCSSHSAVPICAEISTGSEQSTRSEPRTCIYCSFVAESSLCAAETGTVRVDAS